MLRTESALLSLQAVKIRAKTCKRNMQLHSQKRWLWKGGNHGAAMLPYYLWCGGRQSSLECMRQGHVLPKALGT